MSTKPIEDDAPLVEACINGDSAAWAVLVKRYHALISASIANRLKRYGFDPTCEETEDIRQNVLSSVWEEKKLLQVRNRKKIACWLSIVSGNAAIEHMRRKMADKNPKFISLSDIAKIDDMQTVSQEADEEGFSEMVERAIALLPPKEQLVSKLNLLHGMEYREIAQMLNMPKGTVSSCLKRAKEKLRRRLKDL